MRRRGSRVTGEIGTEYRRLMDLILSRIASGEYPTGSKIPSTAKWEAEGWSRDTVRTAIPKLQADGILVGHPGKGVFVKATPEQAASEHLDIKELGEQVAEMRLQITELRERLGRMEASLATIAGQPRGGRRDQAGATASSGRR
jgi:DNA-binding GntR family transcriptional regulator